MQSTDDFEWIVIDGGSSDGTVDCLREEHAVSFWLSERDRGIYDAMNKGTDCASGTYVMYLNAGDELFDARVLSDVSAAVESSGRIPDLVFCNALLRFQNGRSIVRRARQQSYIRHGIPANHQATFFRRQALTTNPYDLKYRICGDYFLVADLVSRNAECLLVNRTVVRFQVGGTSFQNPRLLISEAWDIQKAILGIGLVGRIRSALRRGLATAATILLNLPLGAKPR
jgi:putative colanic acid biosynthesis glycosyltransferase